jgi:regulatory protein
VSERALELAYRYLNRREHTVAELRRHLMKHDVDEASAAAAIDKLTEQGYLDDNRFARLFAQDKRELERWGSERIRRALLARGIDRDLADATVRSDSGGSDGLASELNRALELLRRRFVDPPRERRERERALRMLLRKGYDHELALDALRVHLSA